ncbi:hypothetical protein EDB19DRAFT_638085 [Suillus lakei]|nr:hypothetical protein EDB19DRAFT_638085 [Suillus lakei]
MAARQVRKLSFLAFMRAAGGIMVGLVQVRDWTMAPLFFSSSCLETRSTTCLSFKYPLKGLMIQRRTRQSERLYRNSGSYLGLNFTLALLHLIVRIHREEGILNLTSGLTVHNRYDRKRFVENLPSPIVKML